MPTKNLKYACKYSKYQNKLDVKETKFKYQGFTPLSCKDIGIRTFYFLAKTNFLC